MDLDKEFAGALLRDGEVAYNRAIERGLDIDVHLVGEGKAACNYILEFRKEYGTIPSPDLLSDNLGLSIPVAKDPFDALLDKVLQRRLWNVIKEGADKVKTALEKRDNAEAAAEQWHEVNRKIQEQNLTGNNKVIPLFGLVDEVWKLYDLAKSGVRGINMPWQSMMDQTMGWQPEDLGLIVGRLGQGKTTCLLLMAHAAWKDKKKVLIISTEMSKVKLLQRFLAITLRLPYEAFRKGRLGEFAEPKARAESLALAQDRGIQIVGGAFDYSIDAVDSAIEEFKPDIACVDGAYLIKNSGKDRHERVSNTFDDLKRIGSRRKISVLTNTQFNRSAKAGNSDTIAADNVGMTDVAGWNADFMYGLWQSKEMFDSKIMGMKALKIREGKPLDFITRWDWDTMDFTEIREHEDIGFASLPTKSDEMANESTGIADTVDNDDLPF
jgi:KaiC/GvpD/RAD55 family RecA-like ATPase